LAAARVDQAVAVVVQTVALALVGRALAAHARTPDVVHAGRGARLALAAVRRPALLRVAVGAAAEARRRVAGRHHRAHVRLGLGRGAADPVTHVAVLGAGAALRAAAAGQPLVDLAVAVVVDAVADLGRDDDRDVLQARDQRVLVVGHHVAVLRARGIGRGGI